MHAPPCSGVSVGMYLTSSTEACYTIARDSKANIIVVENDSQMQKILQVCVCAFIATVITLISPRFYHLQYDCGRYTYVSFVAKLIPDEANIPS